ncbi:MAG: hypothetical protein ACMUHU_01475 [Thermoplasmatota archaeon]
MRGTSASKLGAAELSMGLLIAAVVTSVSVPLVMTAYSDLSAKVTVDALEEEIGHLLRMVRAVMDSGNGSTAEVDIEISHFGSSRVERVAIGGPPGSGSERFMVSYEVSGHGRGFMSLDPPLPMTTVEGEGLQLDEGGHTLILRNVQEGTDRICLIEVQ